MSDEHKPHDDHGHDAGHAPDDHAAQPAAEAHGHDDHAGEAPAAEADGHEAHAPDAHAAEAQAQDAPAHDDHAAPAAEVHEAHGDAAARDDHAPAAAHDDHGHNDHGHDAPAAEAAAHDGHGHAEPAAAQDDHGPEAALAAAAVAGGAAVAATASSRPPVWSDSGDAPFEDVDSTPVYARGKGGKKSKSKGSSNEGMEIFKTIFFALLIAFVLRVVLFQPFTIPSASMEPNLYEGDYIVVSKWTYGYSKHSIPWSPPLFNGRILGSEPKRGDIVVFKLPRDNTTDYIKRLIGLPGDRIQMIDNVLFINGTAVRDVEMSRQDVQNLYGSQLTIQLRETLPEGRQINVQDWGPGFGADNTPVFEVPAGHYFMIGDNRDNSQDSRYDRASGVGYVPAENLIGKAEVILFSWHPGASLWNPVSWFQKVRLDRFFTRLD